MSDHDTLQIRIPTGHLRALLTETGALARLESFACEKIAEELIRKAPRAVPDAAAITRQADRAVDQVIDRKMRELAARWSMPGAVLGVIREEVAKVVEAQVKTTLDGIVKRASSALSSEVSRAIEVAEQRLRDITLQQRAEFAAHMEERMAGIARLSFFQVLREAKEGVA